MTPERWALIEEVFHRAADCDVEQRASLLDQLCNGDTELRREVEVLLASEKSPRDDVRAAIHGGLHAITFPLSAKRYRITAFWTVSAGAVWA